MKFGCSIGIFLNSATLICRSTDISKCFRGSLRLRDNESRLYLFAYLEGLFDFETTRVTVFIYLFTVHSRDFNVEVHPILLISESEFSVLDTRS